MPDNEYAYVEDIEELLLLFDAVHQEEEERLTERFTGTITLRHNVAKQVSQFQRRVV